MKAKSDTRISYEPQGIEAKWQKRWNETALYEAKEDPTRPKYYFLTMLPYTSGDLHIGHWYAMAPSDAKARFMRMNGYNVFFPIGFDAFGLPAENAAIKRGIHPHTWTLDNVERMRKQLRSMGAMWAWDSEAITCLPGFYKWTEWFFLKFYEKGLAYRKRSPVDFCPKCNTTLAREQVWGEDRHCERCGTPVIKKDLEQWFFRITNYAQELLDGLDKIDWPERVKTMQRNWIGRSEGARVVFKAETGDPIEVFTTRPDTLWGATFMVLAPEHPLVDKLTTPACRKSVEDYKFTASRQSEIERLAADKEKTGVFIGAYAINPVNGERIPIWIADYVLMAYGTGAIMGVPSHDERDFAFALEYGLPILPVIDRIDGAAKSIVRPGATRPGLEAALSAESIPYEKCNDTLHVTLNGNEQIDRYVELVRRYLVPEAWVEIVGAKWLFIFGDETVSFNSCESDAAILARCKGIVSSLGWRDKALFASRTTMEMLASQEWYRDTLLHAEYGAMINSGEFTGTPGGRAKAAVTDWLEEKEIGSHEVNYRMHDWLISRQRYWGAPIPMIYCEQCGIVPVPYEDLPVLLPDDAQFMPTGESPLKYHEAFVNTTCPQCGGPAKRETDTMDTFMCSSWYHYAYVSPYYDGDVPIDPAKGAYWLPVDQYTGGIEHATMHLLYTRFFTKVLRDIGLVDFDEPMLRLFNQGIILGEDNEKMSKSQGNVVNPDDYVGILGADAVRAFLMFIGPWELGGSWSSTGLDGLYRFINRMWTVALSPREKPTKAATPQEIAELQRLTHKTIKRVTDDIEAFKFNTALAALMQFNNFLIKAEKTNVYATDAWDQAIHNLILMIAPIMPHVSEEIWERIGGEYSVHTQSWPVYDEKLAADEVITLIVQVNGRVRARIEVSADIDQEEAQEVAVTNDNVKRYTEDKEIVKLVYVPGRLVNIVVR
jgi:leucyl-tRNA synthetase